MNRDRYAELKRILEERRREIMEQVQEKIRDVRTESPNSPTQGVLDAAESSEADIQDEIEFALIQMKAETLNKIDEALRRLEEGTFGYCFECGEEISRAPAARAAVRGPLQGLRGGARDRAAARAPDGAAPRRRLALHRHAGITFDPCVRLAAPRVIRARCRPAPCGAPPSSISAYHHPVTLLVACRRIADERSVREDRSPTSRRRPARDRRTAAVDPGGAAGAAAARHGAVSELLHAAGRRARERRSA